MRAKMSKQNNKKTSVDDIAKDISAICKKNGLNPYNLSKAQYYKLGGSHSDWELRSAGGLRNIVDAFFRKDKPEDGELVLDLKEIRKDYNKLLNEQADVNRLLARVKDTVSKLPKMTGPTYKPNKNKSTERVLTAVFSDHHIGSDIVKPETKLSYGPVEEARALAYLTENIINYKLQYRDETVLNLLMIGDIIENELHGRTSADLLHLQTCRAIWLYPQVLKQLAANFKKIRVYFAVGNHGRDMAIHQQRATSLKYNALETTIYYAIRQAMSDYKNIEFIQPMTPWVEFELFENKGYATHGDTHLNPGNPGKKIDVGGLENQINRINASLKDDEEYKVFVAGHVHQALITPLPNRAYLIVNGALTPPNTFAQSLNIMEAPQIQVMWEAVPNHPVGDSRMIDVSKSANDKNLDKIIVPFKGL